MQRKTLKNGLSMPVLGMGAYRFGGGFMQYDPKNQDQIEIDLMKSLIGMGYMHIDEAENYADGASEGLLGQAIKDLDREKLFIVSKVAKEVASSEDLMIRAKKSLDRMGIDKFDCYLIHAPPVNTSMEEVFKGLNQLVASGLADYVGVSNFNVSQMKQAMELSDTPILCNQVHYSVSVREVEVRGVLEFCQKNDILLVAYRSIKVELDEEWPDLIKEIATKYKKTPIQTMINWLVSQQNVVALVQSFSMVHMHEDLGSIDWQMSKEDIELIRSDYPKQLLVSPVFELQPEL